MSFPVGFVGLGSMGGAMARNMAAGFGRGALASHRAVLYDLAPGRAQSVAAGHAGTARVAGSLDELARACRMILLCLPDGQAVRSSVTAMAAHLPRDALVVDTSTTGPEAAHAAAASLGGLGRGLAFLDAPVTGAPARAEAGTLTVMAGGELERLQEAEPVLRTFASRVLHMGAVGNGQIAKAMNNCLYNVNCAAMAEMLPLAQKAGLPLEAFAEVVSTGTGQSFGFDQWAPRVLAREFEAPKHGYPMGAAFKDLETVSAVASEHSLAAPPVVSAARATYERALAMGLEGEHKGAMVKVWEAELGVTCVSGRSAAAEGFGSRGRGEG